MVKDIGEDADAFGQGKTEQRPHINDKVKSFFIYY